MTDDWADAKTADMAMCPCGSTTLCRDKDGEWTCPQCRARYTNVWIQIDKTPHDDFVLSGFEIGWI